MTIREKLELIREMEEANRERIKALIESKKG